MATLATKSITLVAPSGWALHEVTAWSSAKSSDPYNLYYGLTLANGVSIAHKTTTETGGRSVTIASDGAVTLSGSGAGSFKFRYYQNSAWSAEQTWNQPVGTSIEAVNGAFTVTGNAATLSKTLPMTGAAGAFIVTGASAELRYNRLVAATGTFTATGQPVTFVRLYDSLPVTLAAPPGWAVHTITTTAEQANKQCLYFGQTVAVGNQILHKTTSETHGHGVTVDSSGLVTLAAAGADTVKFRIYNGSTWSAELTFAGPLSLPVSTGAFTATGHAVQFSRSYGTVQILFAPPPGWKWLEVGTVEQSSSSFCIYHGHNVQPGDQVLYKATTESSGLAVTVDRYGVVVTTPGGVDTLKFRIYSYNAGTWSNELTFNVTRTLWAERGRAFLSGGSSSTNYISAITTLPIQLEVPPEYQLHAVTDVSRAGIATCLYYGLGLAVGSRIMLSQQTELFGWPVSVDSYGFLVIHSSGDGRKDWIRYRVWDVSDSTWSNEATFAVSAIIKPQTIQIDVATPAAGVLRGRLFVVDRGQFNVVGVEARGGKQALLFANASVIISVPTANMTVPYDTFNIMSIGSESGRIYHGQNVVIFGTAFGADPGVVRINGVQQTIVSWSNRYVEIVVNAPSTGFFTLEMEKAA